MIKVTNGDDAVAVVVVVAIVVKDVELASTVDELVYYYYHPRHHRWASCFFAFDCDYLYETNENLIDYDYYCLKVAIKYMAIGDDYYAIENGVVVVDGDSTIMLDSCNDVIDLYHHY